MKHDHLHRLVGGRLGHPPAGAKQEGVARAGQLDAGDRRADADLDGGGGDRASDGYAFAGQSCISVQRVYVDGPSTTGFVERLVPKVEALKVGDPLDDDTEVGR